MASVYWTRNKYLFREKPVLCVSINTCFVSCLDIVSERSSTDFGIGAFGNFGQGHLPIGATGLSWLPNSKT